MVTFTIFVIQVNQHPAGGLSGVVERVRDGVKAALPADLADVGTIIRRLLPPAPPETGPQTESSLAPEEPQ